jgi:membrane protease YdiL (CAAX protease family)
MKPTPGHKREPIKSFLIFGLRVAMASGVCIGLVSEVGTRLSRALSLALLLMLVMILPAISVVVADEYRRTSTSKLSLYLRHLMGQWALAAWGVLAVLKNRSNLHSFGFRAVPSSLFFDWSVSTVIVGFLGIGFLALAAHWKLLPFPTDEVSPLTPRTRIQKLVAGFVLAPSIGVCEEFLYRGFALTELTGWLHSLTAAFVISSLAFGVAHAYQGTTGILRAAMIGAFLACPVIAIGSLYPSMVLHSAYDALMFVWIGPRRLRRQYRHEK